MADFLDITGLGYFKTKQDAANDAKFAKKTDLSGYQTTETAQADKSELMTEIGKKVDKTTYESKVASIEASIEEKADQEDLEQLQSDLTTKLTAVYRYKGTKPSYSELPSSGNEIGDVWDVNNGMNYAWNGSDWDALGDTRIEVDATLSDSSTNAVQNKVVKKAIDEVTAAQANFVPKTQLASDDTNGLMSSADFTKLKNIPADANNYVPPTLAGGAKTIDLYKVAVNGNGYVTETSKVTKEDITALGITDTTYSSISTTEIDSLFV